MRVAAAVALAALVVAPAGAASPRARCRVECRAAIDACVAAGGRRRRCRRDVLRRCRGEGTAACGGTTTTSTTVTGATTTTTLGAVNGCDPASAADFRGQPSVTVQFGDALGNRYDPACFTVSPGTAVTFSGAFTVHPLVGGRVVRGVRTPDPASPFGGPTESGDTKTVTLSAAGTFPFYCDVHATVGMTGVAFVAP